MTSRHFLAAIACLALLAGCGKTAETPAEPAPPAAESAPAQSVPASEAEPTEPRNELDAAGQSDGETVEAATASTSAVHKAVEASTPALAATVPTKWVEGQHYIVLPAAQPVSTSPGQVEVVEIFWYGCGHCYTLEARVESWERNKPAYIQLRRLPIIWNELTREDARLFYTIEGLNKVSTLHAEVFRELHVNRRPLTVIAGNKIDLPATEKAARDFLMARGVSAEDFGRHYRSFSIENRLRQAEDMARRYMADHTPMIVVHGKYVTDMTMAGSTEDLFQIVNDLAARELAGR